MANQSNLIEIYQHNTKTFSVTVTGLQVTGFIPYLSVKKNTADPSTLLFNTGVVTDPSTLLFTIPSTNSSLNSGDYLYDITIEKDASIYTITKDTFRVLDGVRY